MTDPRIIEASAAPPGVIARPPLAVWLFERGIDYRAAGRGLGFSHEAVRRWCLPFSDPARLKPKQEARRRIDNWTRGEIAPASFDPPPSFTPPVAVDPS